MTRNNIIKTISAALAMAVIAVCAQNNSAHADLIPMNGYGGRGGSGGGGGNGVACTQQRLDGMSEGSFTIDCQGWSWIFFEYVESSGETGDTYYAPYDSVGVSSTGGGVKIDAGCATAGGGFWHLGRNYITNGYTFSAGFDWNGGMGSIYQYALVSDPNHPGSRALGHRETYTLDRLRHYGAANYVDYSTERTFTNIIGKGNYHLGQVLTKNGKVMYRATKYGTSAEVLQSYKDNGGTGEYLPDDIYAFCADGDTPPPPTPDPQNYTGEVTLKVDWSHGTLTGEAVDLAVTSTQSDIVDVPVDHLIFNAYGKVIATDEEHEQQATKYTVSALVDGDTKHSGSFSNNNSENSPSEDTSLQLVPDTVYEICATNTYATQWTSKKGFTDDATLTACVKVRYNYRVDCSNIYSDTYITSDLSTHINYGTMALDVNSLSVVVGNDFANPSYSKDVADPVWINPDESDLTLNYYGCMGAQVGASGTTIYNIASSIDDGTENGKLYGKPLNNYVSHNSKEQQNVTSEEVSDYQFAPMNSISNRDVRVSAGAIYNNTMSFDGRKLSIDVYAPYNYLLLPSLHNVAVDSLSLGSVIAPSASFKKGARVNSEVKGEAEYATNDIKDNTKAVAWLFTIPSTTSFADFQSGLASIGSRVGEDYYYADATGNDLPMNRLGGTSATQTLDFTADDIRNSTVKEFSPLTIGEGVAVGTKICVMAAVWPADSHNNLTSTADQQWALTKENGPGALWRFEVQCATVGKKPTVSIEGGSLIARNVNTSTTRNRSADHANVLGSWAEYDLIAGTTSGHPGSGASLAYASQQTVKNSAGSPSVDGFYEPSTTLRSKSRNPQTLGNESDPKEGAVGYTEIGAYVSQSSIFAYNIVAAANSPDKTHVEYYKNDPDGMCVIDANVPADPSKIWLIHCKNVMIRPNVDEINAMIVAKNELDTCYEPNGASDKYEQDAGGDNQLLLDNCNTQLIINGAVYAGNVLNLDRTHGGGSLDFVNGEYYLNSATLAQRAEIFNYDPRIVKYSYDFMKTYEMNSESYVRELTPRL